MRYKKRKVWWCRLLIYERIRCLKYPFKNSKKAMTSWFLMPSSGQLTKIFLLQIGLVMLNNFALSDCIFPQVISGHTVMPNPAHTSSLIV